MQITLDNSIETVLFNNVSVDKIIFNGTTVWEKMSMFNFTGIDANGNYETQLAFNGTVIEYAIGKPKYIYLRYDQVIPTPTEASGYENKVVYNESTDEFVVYSSSLSWVVIGTTPCYTVTAEYRDREFDVSGTNYRYYNMEYSANNGLNPNFFGENYDFSTQYSDPLDMPELDIETIVIPNTYNGKNVTKILRSAFVGEAFTSQTQLFYIGYEIKHFTLGTNIKELDANAMLYICRISTYNNINTFTFNNNLQVLNSTSLSHVFEYNKHDPNCVIRLPSSVVSLHAETFGAFAFTSNAIYIYKLIISSPQIECVDDADYGIADCCDYVVFERSVQNLSGTLQYTAADTSYYKNIVFKHLQNDQITLNIEKNKSAVACTIYTDCDAVKNYDWASQNYTVTFKPLSEYEGD